MFVAMGMHAVKNEANINRRHASVRTSKMGTSTTLITCECDGRSCSVSTHRLANMTTSNVDTVGTNVVPLLLLLYGIILVGGFYLVVSFVQKYRLWPFYTRAKASAEKVRDTVHNKNFLSSSSNEALLASLDKKMMELNNNSLSNDDISFLATSLKPDSTSWDIITACLATPSTVLWSCIDYDRVALTRAIRMERDQKLKSGNQNSKEVDVLEALFNDDSGWDNAEDDDLTDADENAKKRAAAAQAEAKRQKDLEQLKKASGHGTELLEGIDPDVLGQLWVEKALSKAGVWPPKDFGTLAKRVFEYADLLNGKKKESLDALNHPGLRRVLCMAVARFHSMMLNGDSQLMDAGMKQLIDQTYFKASMDFRNRITMMLEACIQLAATFQSFTLLSTVLLAMTTFKIGITMDEKTIPWFNTLMTRQYNILPRLKVHSKTIREAPLTNDEGANDDNDLVVVDGKKITLHAEADAEVILDVERIHAAHFLKVKAEQFQKQGIPPQIGLQSYRERWWFMLRMKRTKDPQPSCAPIRISPEAPFSIDPQNLALFEGVPSEDRLLTAWPMTITNISQQKGRVKVQFPAPSEPGSYKYLVRIQSVDFLGADQDLEFDVLVIEKKATSTTEEASKESVDIEPKKDK
jgi:hypothetical protein